MKLFLDSGDPSETKEILGFIPDLAGQTTNPSLVFKNPEVQERIAKGEKFSLKEIHDEYRKIISEIAMYIPDGAISIEVYADMTTTSEEMMKQARDMHTWTKNSYIKFPCTHEGIKASNIAVKESINVNLTLCFSVSQAAAVYEATKDTVLGSVFISPFIGRLDDHGTDGIDLIKQIVHLYETSDHHVEVLAASIRNINHLKSSLNAGTDIATVPFHILQEWSEAEKTSLQIEPSHLNSLEPVELSLGKNWEEYDVAHPLTTQGIEKFVSDWKKLL